MRTTFTVTAFSLAIACGLAAPDPARAGTLRMQLAQASWEIMAPEPGERRTRKPTISETLPREIPPKDGKPRPRPRGSSSPSPLPAPRSVVTPLGVPSRTIEPPSIAQPARDPGPVPGRYGTAVPPPSVPIAPGQTFQDRAIGCIHSGSGGGVSPGQIGAYTQGCVNQR
jgi:hypothetical protein